MLKSLTVKLNKILAFFLTLFYCCCWWIVRFGVHMSLRIFWWCKDDLFRGRKWIEISSMSQNDLQVLEGKLADLALVPCLSPVSTVPLWALWVPSEIWVLFRFLWWGLWCGLQILLYCQQGSERLPMVMHQHFSSGVSYQCELHWACYETKQTSLCSEDEENWNLGGRREKRAPCLKPLAEEDMFLWWWGPAQGFSVF